MQGIRRCSQVGGGGDKDAQPRASLLYDELNPCRRKVSLRALRTGTMDTAASPSLPPAGTTSITQSIMDASPISAPTTG